jgi:hypothetical protein
MGNRMVAVAEPMLKPSKIARGIKYWAFYQLS